MDELFSGAGGTSQAFSRTLPATPEERHQVLTGERREASVVRRRPTQRCSSREEMELKFKSRLTPESLTLTNPCLAGSDEGP